MPRWWALLGLVALLAACGGASATPTVGACTASGGKPVYDLLQSYSVNWEKAANRADTAPRTALAAEIESMRTIRRDLSAEQLPTCGKAAQTAFVAMMDTIIEGFSATVEQQPKETTSAIFERARIQKETLRDEVQKLVR